MKYLLKDGCCVIAIIISTVAFAQEKVLLKIGSVGTRINSFIPKDYDTLEVVYGDLNKDGMEDAVLALHHIREYDYNMDEEPPRLLVILLKTNKGYQLAGKSEEVLMCRHCGGMYGDPFESVEIENGVSTITHYGGSNWRWQEVEKFRYQQNGFYRIGTTTDSYFIGSDCNGTGIGESNREFVDTNWSTGEQHIIKTKDDCSLISDKKNKLKKQPLIALEAYERK